MIVCSCNVVSHREIEAAVTRLREADPNVVLTPGLVYRALGVRPKCGTCLQHIVQLIHAYNAELESEDEVQAQTGPQEGQGAGTKT